MAKRLLHTLLEWLERYDLETRASEDGESILLIRERNGESEVFAATRAIGHTVVELEDLHYQAEGLRSLRKAGYVARMGITAGRMWRPRALVLYRDKEEIFRATDLETWSDAVRQALRWAHLDRVLSGVIEAVEE